MGISSRPQSQRSSTQNRGTDAQGQRGQQARVRNTLKSDRDAMQAKTPSAKRDQFGSQHNEDAIKAEQRTKGRRGQQDLSLRESAQDTRVSKGTRNKEPGGRRRKSGSPMRHRG